MSPRGDRMELIDLDRILGKKKAKAGTLPW